MKIQDLKRGDLFKRKIDALTTYEKGCYCVVNKAYECTDISDINNYIYIKKDKQIYS